MNRSLPRRNLDTTRSAIARRLRSTFISLGVVASTLAAPAWSQAPTASTPWPAIVAAAKKEGTVFFYAPMAVPVLQRLADGFKKAYPEIKVEFTRMNGGPIVVRVDQERSNGADGADLIIGSEVGWMIERSKQGALHKLAGPALNGWPANYLFDGTYFTGAYEVFVLAYNTKLATNPPKTYADMVKPEFKDRLGIPTIPSTLILSWFDWLEKTQGADYPAKVMAQNPKSFISSPPLAQALAAGEISVALLNNPSSLKSLMNSGAPINYNVPNPSYGFQVWVAALGWSKRPNAGLVLADWLMSREGQTVWSGTGESASPLKGIPGAAEVPGSVKFYDINEWTPDVVKRYTERWNQQYKK